MRKIFNLFLLSIFFIILNFIFPRESFAATLYFSPSTGKYEQGSTLKVNVYTNTQGESINAVQANFSYPQDKLQFLSISTAGSVLSIFAEKVGGGGIVKVAGGNLEPFTGSKLIASVYFKVLTNTGSATLSFRQDCAVVKATDNQNALKSTSAATFEFLPKSAVSPTPTLGEVKLEISDVRVENIGKRNATVLWSTNLASNSIVEFGLTNEYGLLASSEDEVINHSVDLPSSLLYPGTKYFFRVISKREDLEAVSEAYTFTTLGYKVVIQVLSRVGRPIEGAEVTLNSEAKTGLTDANGKVVFDNVSLGRHSVLIKYKGQSSTNSIEVSDSEDVQNFTLNTSLGSLVSSTRYVFIILSVLIIFLIFAITIILIKKRKKTEPLINFNLTDYKKEEENVIDDSTSNSQNQI